MPLQENKKNTVYATASTLRKVRFKAMTEQINMTCKCTDLCSQDLMEAEN